MQPESAASLRRVLEHHRPVPVTRGYPHEVRARVVAGVRRLIGEGRRIENLAPELGISRTCLAGWLRTVVVDGSSFAPVVVSEAGSLPAFAPTSMPAGVVISPGGYRVEGLDLEGIASLLRRLP
jgi:hypothetical protein